MNAIFAVNAINGFGTGQDMPWDRSTSDLKRFYQMTVNKTVIMGSSTWNSDMPKPLPKRRNIVLSTTLDDDRCEVYKNITELSMNVNQDEETFVIGGAKVLWALRSNISRVFLTRFNSSREAEIKLDTEKYLDGFKLVEKEILEDHTFEVWERV